MDRNKLDIRIININAIYYEVFIRNMTGYEENLICDICFEKKRRSYYKCKCKNGPICCVECYVKIIVCPFCRDKI